MCMGMATFDYFLTQLMITLKNIYMKKIVYESPWAESLPLETAQSICDLSMETLVIITDPEITGFDDDSD